MIVIRRADKAVVGNIHALPELLNPRYDVIHILLRRHTRGFGLFFDFLAVFVRTGQKHNVVSAHPLVARHNVSCHGAVAVADMQLVRRIVDRRCDIEFLLLHGKSLR